MYISAAICQMHDSVINCSAYNMLNFEMEHRSKCTSSYRLKKQEKQRFG